jgi:hypothetical protein
MEENISNVANEIPERFPLPIQVTVLNILQTQPSDLSLWINEHIMGIRLPVPGANYTVNIQQDIAPMLAVISNRIAFATELHGIIVGAKPGWTNEKKNGGDKVKAEAILATLSANEENLYRAIQSLTTMYEAASRMATCLNQPKGFQ